MELEQPYPAGPPAMPPLAICSQNFPTAIFGNEMADLTPTRSTRSPSPPKHSPEPRLWNPYLIRSRPPLPQACRKQGSFSTPLKMYSPRGPSSKMPLPPLLNSEFRRPGRSQQSRTGICVVRRWSSRTSQIREEDQTGPQPNAGSKNDHAQGLLWRSLPRCPLSYETSGAVNLAIVIILELWASFRAVR